MIEKDRFAAPWDRRLTVLTWVGSVILVGASILVCYEGLRREPTTPVGVAMAAFAAVPMLAFILSALMGPRGYRVAAEGLVIERWVAPISIPHASIRSVERISGDRLSGSIRTLGSGGLFGYYGRFRNRALGSYRMYATRSDDLVLVLSDAPYVLTPDSPERFIAALNRARAAADAPGGY